MFSKARREFHEVLLYYHNISIRKECTLKRGDEFGKYHAKYISKQVRDKFVGYITKTDWSIISYFYKFFLFGN